MCSELCILLVEYISMFIFSSTFICIVNTQRKKVRHLHVSSHYLAALRVTLQCSALKLMTIFWGNCEKIDPELW